MNQCQSPSMCFLKFCIFVFAVFFLCKIIDSAKSYKCGLKRNPQWPEIIKLLPVKTQVKNIMITCVYDIENYIKQWQNERFSITGSIHIRGNERLNLKKGT